jgi:glycosyltransferase involved in cell wall biosynthesis
MSAPRRFAVLQSGARMHYAVPALLASAGMLDALYTDIHAGCWPARLLDAACPAAWRPRALRRLLGRRLPEAIPAGRVYSVPLRAIFEVLRRSHADPGIARRVLARDFGAADALYALMPGDLPAMRAARDRGMFVVFEQVIGPTFPQYLREERERFPGFEAWPDGAQSRAYVETHRELWTCSDLVLAPSAFVAEGIVELGGPAEKIRLVPYGISESLTGLEPAPVAGRVLFVGQVGLRKGSHYLAEAARILKRRHVACEVRVVGEVPAALARNALFDGPVYIGQVPRSEVQREFLAADIFVLPSLAEGSATAHLEALACGLPVIATPNAGTVVRHETEGLIVPIRDARALADAIELLVTDRALRDRLSQAARLRAASFTWPHYRDRLLAALAPANCLPRPDADRRPGACLPRPNADRRPGACLLRPDADRRPGACLLRPDADRSPGAWLPRPNADRSPGACLPRPDADRSPGDWLHCPKARSVRRVDSGACHRPPTLPAAILWIHLGPYHLARAEAVRELCDLTVLELAASEHGCGWDGHRPATPVRTLTLTSADLGEEPPFAAARRVWSALGRLDPRTVFIAGYGALPFLTAALWCRLHRRRAVLFSDTTLADRPRHRLGEALKGPLVRALFDRAIVGGHRQTTYLESLGFAPHPIDRPYLVVDNDYFRTGAAELRRSACPAACGLPATPYFLYVGRLAPEKNLAFLLRAYRAYARDGGAWDLVLAGDGPLAAELRESCTRTGIEGRIHFTGVRTGRDLVACYAFASCFVLASLREAWGLVLNEAMAAGLPLLVSRHCGSSADLVDSGRNAYAFDPCDERELALCLARISQLRPDERAAMGAASSALVERYSLDAWAAAFERALKP